MNNEMIKCGIMNDCINNSLIYYKKFEKELLKKNKNLLSLRKITDKQLIDLKKAYKEFAKHFFSKKTINCMKTFCEPKIIKYQKMNNVIDQLKNKIITTKTKIRLIDKKYNYIILLDTIFIILGHFSKNYQRFYQK